MPTTHILKPAVTGFEDHDLNEHLCLQVARRVGLSAAPSEVRAFEDQRAIIVRRYDRERTVDGAIQRVHQEDVCQALGLPPTAKYQNEGGPTPEQIIELIRRSVQPPLVATQSIARFIDALAFNWIIGGTDAHAKNYSVLLARRQVRLAPLYDVASALPYDDMYPPKLRMAMRIGGEYRIEAISERHWRRLAGATELDEDALLARIADLASQIPPALATVVRSEPVQALSSALPARLLDRISARAHRCHASLDH